MAFTPNKKLFNERANRIRTAACRISFICVKVHFSFVLSACSYQNIFEDKASLAVNLNAHEFAVLNTCFRSLFVVEMNMSSCHDSAVIDFEFTARSDNFTSRSSLQFAGFSYRCLDADCSCIGHSKLNLSFLSCRT